MLYNNNHFVKLSNLLTVMLGKVGNRMIWPKRVMLSCQYCGCGPSMYIAILVVVGG